MEGVGYWIFLLILYSLSMIAKKRKQKQAWREMEDQESDQPSAPKPPEMPGFLQDIFQEIKSEITEDDPEEDYEEEIADDVQEEIPEPIQATPLQNKDESEHSIKWDQPNAPQYDVESDTSLSFIHNLQSSDNLKQAIVLKEILDKPRALRRSIR